MNAVWKRAFCKVTGGSAMTLVLVTVLFVFLLAASVLRLTANSRGLTGHYVDYSSAYDMAMAGNAYAFSFMEDIFDGATFESEEENDYRKIAADMYKAVLVPAGFVMEGTAYKLEWSAEVETDISEMFAAATAVSFTEHNFSVETTVIKYTAGKESRPAKVIAESVWPSIGTDGFDSHKPPVLKSRRE